MINKNSFSIFHRIVTALFLCVYSLVSIFGVSVFAATTTNATTTTTTTQQTLAQTDITTVGMNMFTTAYNWEVGNFTGYSNDAFKGFSKKLNLKIKAQIPSMVKQCG